MTLTQDEAARFWSKVAVGHHDACWDWRAGLFPNGYGQFKWHGRSIQAHRVAWVWATGGELSTARYICHRCDNRKCCNPKHLFDGTARDNVQDAIQKGRRESTVAARRGERCNFTKLNTQSVKEIRAAYATGDVTQQTLAEQYGVTRVAILHIVRRRTWKHI